MSSCSNDKQFRIEDTAPLSEGFRVFSTTFGKNPNDIHHAITMGYKEAKKAMTFAEWTDFLHKQTLISEEQGRNSKSKGERVVKDFANVADKYGVTLDPNDNALTNKIKINKARRAHNNSSKNLEESADIINDILNDISVDSTVDLSSLTPRQASKLGKKLGYGSIVTQYNSTNTAGLFDRLIPQTLKGRTQLKALTDRLVKPVMQVENTLTGLRRNYHNEHALAGKESGLPSGKLVSSVYDVMDRTKSVGGLTQSHSVLMYLANKRGDAANSGLTDSEIAEHVAYVENNPKLQALAERLYDITGDGWVPTIQESTSGGESWEDYGILGTLGNYLRTTKRAQLLADSGWTGNKNVMLDETFYNNIRANYRNGDKVVKALKSNIKSLQYGNTSDYDNEYLNAIHKWGALMIGLPFGGNPEIGVKQLTSALNYVDAFGPNNLISAATVLGTKRWRENWVRVMQSDYVRNRFQSKSFDNEVAALAASGDFTPSHVKQLWRKVASGYITGNFGFVSLGDVGAIILGGTGYVTNYQKHYEKQINESTGKKYTKEEAYAKAEEGFIENSEKTQQSRDVTQLSPDQRDFFGKLVLHFTSFQQAAHRFATASYRDAKRAGDGNILKAPLKDQLRFLAHFVFYRGISPMMFNAVTDGLINAALGGAGEPDEEWIKEMGIGVAEFNLVGRGKWGKLAFAAIKVARYLYKEENPTLLGTLDEGSYAVPSLDILSGVVVNVDRSIKGDDSKLETFGKGVEGIGISTQQYVQYYKNWQYMLREKSPLITDAHLSLGWRPSQLGLITRESNPLTSAGRGSKQGQKGTQKTRQGKNRKN